MEQSETSAEEAGRAPVDRSVTPSMDGPAVPPPPVPRPPNGGPESGGGAVASPGPSTAEMAPPAFIYAVGRIEPRFPSLAAEKELAQATGRTETAGLSDRQALQAVLAERRKRYLVRSLCWGLTIEGLDTYILTPRD